MVEVMKIMATSFKRSHAGTVAHSAPSPAAGHRQPTSLPRTLDTHRQVWVSLLWGVTAPFSWVLCTQAFVCALQELFV